MSAEVAAFLEAERQAMLRALVAERDPAMRSGVKHEKGSPWWKAETE